MKILTVCQGGCVRSVGLKFLLRYKYGHDVLNCGFGANTDDTRKMLYDWADCIIVVDKSMMDTGIPAEYKHKSICYQIGEDVFGYAFHPVLQQMCEQFIQQHGVFTKKGPLVPS